MDEHKEVLFDVAQFLLDLLTLFRFFMLPKMPKASSVTFVISLRRLLNEKSYILWPIHYGNNKKRLSYILYFIFKLSIMAM